MFPFGIQIKMNISTVLLLLFIIMITESTANLDKTEHEVGSIRKSCSKRGYIVPPPGRVDTTANLRKLRQHMLKENSIEGPVIQAYLITSDDEHQSESVTDHDRRREYISGFSGTSGEAIVTQTKAVLWTDGRYHLQADEEIDCNWLLMKHGRPGVPNQADWLRQNLKAGSRIGVDPKLMSNSAWEYLNKELQNSSLQLVPVRKNLVDLIWNKNRPPPSNKLVYIWDLKFAGKPWMEKVAEVREELRAFGADAMVVTALDEIAWLLNIRGRDIPRSPFVKSYIILSMDEIHFYVDSDKITANIRTHLKTIPGGNPFSVIIHEYEHIWTNLSILSQQWRQVLLPSRWVYSPGVSRAIFMTVPKDKHFSKPSPILFLKAQKNDVEISGMENASIRDSAGLIEFFAYFEEQFYRGEHWDELTVVKTVDEYRLAQEFCTGASFETIAGFGPNGAKPHYESSNITNIPIDDSSTLVLDSGGQYFDGTTDVTRTLHFGTPTEEQRFAYTKVLMGQIDLSTFVFPSNLKIAEADILARAPLWQAGMDYMHGTGHGVGAFLSVHESPISVFYSAKQGQTFKLGYFFSNEPGYYKDGDFGIRLENIMEVVHKHPRITHYSGEIYLGFKVITLVPYESKLIDYSMLTIYQKRWLNDYNTQIRSLVGAELKRQRKMDAFYWMMEKTKHIPEYGPYSTAAIHSPYLYIFTTIIILINLFTY